MKKLIFAVFAIVLLAAAAQPFRDLYIDLASIPANGTVCTSDGAGWITWEIGSGIGLITPGAIAGNTNDYNPAGFSASTGALVITSTGNNDITGIQGTANGHLLMICAQTGGGDLKLKKDSNNSALGNRICEAGDVNIPSGTCAWLLYLDPAGNQTGCWYNATKW